MPAASPLSSAASIHAYKEPRALYIQRMPHIALSETSSTDSWVTDSAAGMTAIVTGRKTANGVLSQAPPRRPPKRRRNLKTILEYAEEHGLSTGVISNMNMADATPAACYAHVNSRKKMGEIFAQIWKPRYGDGVDVVFGNGRKKILESTKELGIDLPRSSKPAAAASTTPWPPFPRAPIASSRSTTMRTSTWMPPPPRPSKSSPAIPKATS